MKLLLLLLLSVQLPAAYATGTAAKWDFENSADGFPSALTVTGSPTYVTGAAKGAYWYKTVPASGAFFSWPADANSAFSSLNNWAIECYIEKYARAANSWIWTNAATASGADATIGCIIGSDTDDNVAVYTGPSGTFLTCSGTAFVNRRLHLGITAGTWGREIWVDGALGASDGTNSAMPANLLFGKIGTFNTGGVVSAQTYIDDFRVSNVRRTGFPTVDPVAVTGNPLGYQSVFPGLGPATWRVFIQGGK